MTVLIDSWAWIEYFKGTIYGKKSGKYIEGEEEIIISAINVAEIYKFLLKNNPRESENLIAFVLKASFVIPITAELALKSAKNRHEKNLGMADAIVLATAQLHNARIITGDDDFKDIDNLELLK